MYDEIYESEKVLEEKLINDLVDRGYERVYIKNEKELFENFKKQINRHNLNKGLKGKELSDKEFERLKEKILGKNVIDSSIELRCMQNIERDDQSEVYLELFNTIDWCQNIFQVTNQLKSEYGKNKNIYDINILINGIPVVQIELKRRGIDFTEAFNQINRYKKNNSYQELFRFIQFFVISNGQDTKYFSNSDDNKLSFERTFYWTDKNNKRCDTLSEFTNWFLDKCWVAKMISKYTIIDKKNKTLIIMRPYQIFAVEALIDKSLGNNNAYVWHTTGSGKTLTSFKLATLLRGDRNIFKVIFLVDRRDLDGQTLQEFNRFEEGAVDSTTNSNELIDYLNDSNRRLIVTTIQKMSGVCKKILSKEDLMKLGDNGSVEVDKKLNLDKINRMKEFMDKSKGKKIVFIIDECHRSTFGSMHKAIRLAFNNGHITQYFGFTGTPRFEINKSDDGRTTDSIFNERVHEYLISDAIKDKNVLAFNVDYVKNINVKYNEIDDSKVEDIYTKEVLMSPKRLEQISENILASYNKKTYNIKDYNALFATSDISSLISYYKLLQEKKERFKDTKNLTISAIFTYKQNSESVYDGKDSQECLEDIISDYNKEFGTNFSIKDTNAYFVDVTKRFKKGEIDLLIVVDMLLTGFDSPKLSVLYLDKNLKYHNLIQAFSRTNRKDDLKKMYGNIVCYQTTNYSIDNAIELYSNKNNEVVLMKSMKYYENLFKNVLNELYKNSPTPSSILELEVNTEKNREFVKIFRELARILNSLNTFLEFEFTKKNIGISKGEFNEYRSKYLRLYAESRKNINKESILADVDFCNELVSNDKIDFEYIMKLLAKDLKKSITKENIDEYIKKITEKIDNSGNKKLFLKRDLIRAFIIIITPKLDNIDDFFDEYRKFEDEERKKDIKYFSYMYGFDENILNKFIEEYIYSGEIDKEVIRDNINLELIKKTNDYEGSTNLKIKKEIQDIVCKFVEKIIDKYDL